MTTIESVFARQVWDSRGRPTVETEVLTTSGALGRAIAPSGASTGSREALDRRDGGRRLGGYGVSGAVAAVNGEIAARLRGLDADAQREIDTALITLDGTVQKSRLGGNALVATSLAVAAAAAGARRVPLWHHVRGLAGLDADVAHVALPMIQIFGGGRHADNRVDLQDFLVICPGAASFAEALEWTAEVYLAAQSLMRDKGRLAGVSDEGGLWPNFATNEEALETLTRAIVLSGLKAPEQVGVAIDVAASSFQVGDGYRLALEGRVVSTSALIDVLARWRASFPLLSIEDPVGEDDEKGFVEATRRLGSTTQIVGDDFLATNAAAIARAAARGAGNCALLKANQCGTLSELIDAASAARAAGWKTVQSGRSGESEDVSLAHLAVGLMSDQIKVGAMARSERAAKWNEMLRIEEGLPTRRLDEVRRGPKLRLVKPAKPPRSAHEDRSPARGVAAVRLDDVARVAGVSPISVSRALGNPGRVSEATRQRVLKAVAETGYIVNSHASTLKSGRSSIIPVFVSSLQNAHFANALQGASDAFEGSRLHLLIAQTSYSDRLELEALNSVLPFKPAAVMFTGMVQSARARATLEKLGIPVMEMWDYSPHPIDMLVGFSNAEGGRLIGEHFGELGFTRIAFAGRTRDRGAQRLSGFQEGLALFGRRPRLVLPLEGSRSVADGGEALAEIMRKLPDCDAIFFATDNLAIGAIARAKEMGLAVPARIAIAGYGDLEIARQITPALTSVHIGPYEMGLKAGRMLRARIEGEPLESAILRCPVRLEVRASTRRHDAG